MKIKMSKENTIGIIAAVLAAWVFYNFFTAPQINGIRAVRSKCVSAERLLSDRENEMKKLEDFKASNARTKKELEAAKNRFFSQDEINVFLNSLNKLAEATGNKLKTVNLLPEKTLEASTASRVPVEVTISGSYPGILDFVDALTSGEKLLDLSDFHITKEDEASEALTASFQAGLFIEKKDRAL